MIDDDNGTTGGTPEAQPLQTWAEKFREGLLRSLKSMCVEVTGQSFRQAILAKGAYSYSSVYEALKHGNPTLRYIEKLCTDVGLAFPDVISRAVTISRTL
jgi:hypothetical protein